MLQDITADDFDFVCVCNKKIKKSNVNQVFMVCFFSVQSLLSNAENNFVQKHRAAK